jgi:fermentation-respiration switch protein FrsA (DUF1100 family)
VQAAVGTWIRGHNRETKPVMGGQNMASLSICTLKQGPLIWMANAFRYAFAPFFPSEWTIRSSEPQGITVPKLKRAAFKLCIYYLLFSPLIAMPFYNTCIFHPYMAGDFDLKEIAGVKKRDVFFTTAGESRLHGWLFKQQGAKKTVLLSHGNAGNLTHRTDLISLLLQSGASVFIYDYRGFGRSQGQASVDGCCDDATAAYDYLSKNLCVPSDQIVLYGESIGTGFTAQLSARRPSAGIILQSAFQSLPQIAREKLPYMSIYPTCFFAFNNLNTMSILRKVHPPLLLIHGKKDEIIPYHNAQDLFHDADGIKDLVSLPNAGHNDITNNVNAELLSALSKFLR